MQIYRHLFRLFTNRPSHLLQKKILLFLNMYLTLKKNVSKAGYSLVVCTVDAPASDSIRKHMKLLDARKTGGILLGLSDSKLIEETASLNYSHIPLISLSSSVSNVCSTFLLDYKGCICKSCGRIDTSWSQKHRLYRRPPMIATARRLHCRGYQNALFFPFPYSSKHHILTQTHS